MTFLKWLLIIFVLVPLTFILLAAAVLKLTPQEKLRRMAAQEIGHRLHRQIDIGPAMISLNGLTLENLKVSEVPNFKAGLLFSAKHVSLGWDLRTLWEGLNLRTTTITRSSGRFHVDEIDNPHYIAHDFSMHWSLSDIDPSGSHLIGWAKLEQGTGLLLNIDQLMETTPSAKIALAPVLALMNMEKLGILKIGLPDLKRWPIQQIQGDYTFKNGQMTIRNFTMDSPQLGMETTGTVGLGDGALALDVQLHSPPHSMMGEMNAKARVSGNLSHPKVDLDSLKKKSFKATLTNLIQ